MSELYEVQVNLPEDIMDDLEADAPVYTTDSDDILDILNSEESYKVPEEDVDAIEVAFEAGVLGALESIDKPAKSQKSNKKVKSSKKPTEKQAKSGKSGQTISDSTKIASSPVKTSKKDTPIKTETTKKPLSKKAAEMERLKSLCDSTEAVQEFNTKTGKQDVKISMSGKLETIYSYKGRDAYIYKLMENARGRGAKLLAAGIKTCKVTAKDGSTYTVTAGQEKPKLPKKSKGVKTSEGEVAPIPVVAYGQDELKGESKEGMITAMTAKAYVVTFPSKKHKGIVTNIEFSKKTGLEVDPRPYHSFKINLEDIKVAV